MQAQEANDKLGSQEVDLEEFQIQIDQLTSQLQDQ